MMFVPKLLHPNTHRRHSMALLAAAALLTAPLAEAADVKVFVLAPKPPASLATVETQGSDKPVFTHSYAVPYATLEKQLRQEIKSKVDFDTGEQTEGCPTALCPDVHWRVVVSSDIAFTKKPLPALKAFGDAQANGVDVNLKDAQVRLKLAIHAEMWIIVGTGKLSDKIMRTVDVPVELLIGVNVASRLNAWPALVSATVPCEVTQMQETVCVNLPLEGKNIDLSDAEGAVVDLGAALGGLIGFTQFGGLADPLSGLLGGKLLSKVAELGAKAAANQAEARVQAEATKALNAWLKVFSIQATYAGGTYLDAQINQINALKDKILNTKLPQINKSYQDLANAFGLSFDVQTRVSNGDAYVIVTPRFAASPGGGKIVGKLRMPKEACLYASSEWGTMPLELVKVNEDLAGKVGQSCQGIMPPSSIRRLGYFGADPKILKVGANPLPTWTAVGNATLTGTLSEQSHGSGLSSANMRGAGSKQATGYYECGFEISGLPNADIIDLRFKDQAAERLPGYASDPYRFVEASFGGYSALLNADWSLASTPLVLGGEGYCSPPQVKIPNFQLGSWLDRVKDLFDPDKCANCDIELVDGMLMVTNSRPVLENPALKPLFDALRHGRALPAAVGAPVPQAPTIQAPSIQAPSIQAPTIQAPTIQAPTIQAPPINAPGIQAPPIRKAPATTPAPRLLQPAPGLKPGLLAPGTQKGAPIVK